MARKKNDSKPGAPAVSASKETGIGGKEAGQEGTTVAKSTGGDKRPTVKKSAPAQDAADRLREAIAPDGPIAMMLSESASRGPKAQGRDYVNVEDLLPIMAKSLDMLRAASGLPAALRKAVDCSPVESKAAKEAVLAALGGREALGYEGIDHVLAATVLNHAVPGLVVNAVADFASSYYEDSPGAYHYLLGHLLPGWLLWGKGPETEAADYDSGANTTALGDWGEFLRRRPDMDMEVLRGRPFAGDDLGRAIGYLQQPTVLRVKPGPASKAMVAAITLACLDARLTTVAVVNVEEGAKDAFYDCLLTSASGVPASNDPANRPGDEAALASATQVLSCSVLRRLYVSVGRAGEREAGALRLGEHGKLLVVIDGGAWEGARTDYLLEVKEPGWKPPAPRTTLDLVVGEPVGDETPVTLRVNRLHPASDVPVAIPLMFEISRRRFRFADAPADSGV